ncbi:MAG: zinc ribbon domain-containing protein, partial [Gemmatimonadota bacterium]|nr:zinc ribbon domain-containing protein [Gemmatimonadota bacterium]
MNKRSLFHLGIIFLAVMFTAGPVLAFFCPNCGQDFATREKFCSNCGLPLQKVQTFVETYRTFTQQQTGSMDLEPPAAASSQTVIQSKPAAPEQPDHPDISVTKSPAGTVVIEAQGRVVHPENTDSEPEPAVITGHGTMELILLYQGSDPEKYSKSGRVYVNDKLIGSIYMMSPAEMVGKGGYSTELFGYASGLSNKRYYRFRAEKIPVGTYQVKVVL